MLGMLFSNHFLFHFGCQFWLQIQFFFKNIKSFFEYFSRIHNFLTFGLILAPQTACRNWVKSPGADFGRGNLEFLTQEHCPMLGKLPFFVFVDAIWSFLGLEWPSFSYACQSFTAETSFDPFRCIPSLLSKHFAPAL